MSSPDPALHLIVGPNGAGRSTFFARVVGPATGLDFVNADVIAADRWPGAEVEHAYAAARLAAAERDRLIDARCSFVAETVFSHRSKVDLLRRAERASFRVALHVVLIPEELAVARVVSRVAHGGHHVPENKVRERFARLWDHVVEAIEIVDGASVYDNSRAADPFRLVASYRRGRTIGNPDWPAWTPTVLQHTGP